MFFKVVVVLNVFVVCLTVVSASILQDCSNKSQAIVTQVILTGCDFNKDEFCTLVKGSSAQITVSLVPRAEVSTARLELGAKLNSLYLPFPLKPDDACANYGLNCPMKKDSNQTLSIGLPILNVYPTLSNLLVQLRLKDSDNKEIICVAFPAAIVKN